MLTYFANLLFTLASAILFLAGAYWLIESSIKMRFRLENDFGGVSEEDFDDLDERLANHILRTKNWQGEVQEFLDKREEHNEKWRLETNEDIKSWMGDISKGLDDTLKLLEGLSVKKKNDEGIMDEAIDEVINQISAFERPSPVGIEFAAESAMEIRAIIRLQMSSRATKEERDQDANYFNTQILTRLPDSEKINGIERIPVSSEEMAADQL